LNNFNARYLTEAALLTAIGIMITIGGTLIPFLNFLLIVIPVPYIIIGVKNDLKYSAMGLVVTAIIVSMFISPIQGIFFIAIAGAPSLALSYGIVKKYNFSKTLLVGFVGNAISVFVMYAVLPMILGNNIMDTVDQYFATLGTTTNYLSEIGLGDPEKTQTIIEQMMFAIKILFPSIIIGVAITQTYIYLIISRLVLSRIGYGVVEAKTFSYFRLPNSFVGGTLIIILMTFLMKYFNLMDVSVLTSNLLYLGMMLMIIQGIAVLSFLLEKKGIGNTLRRVIIGIAFYMGFLHTILIMVGMIDLMIDLRKLDRKVE